MRRVLKPIFAHISAIGPRSSGGEKAGSKCHNKFEASVQYYWTLLHENGINVAIFNAIPHLGDAIILYRLCQAIGVTTIICAPCTFPNAFWLLRRIEDIGQDDIVCDQEPLLFDIVEKPARPFYMKARVRQPFVSLLAGISWQAVLIALKTVSLSFLWNPTPYRKNFFKLQSQYRFFLNQNRLRSAYSAFDPARNYVYFPLQKQPEASTDILGEAYGDQILAVEELSRVLQAEMLIYVKENPKQSSYMRDESFYQRLLAIPQVRFISIDVSTFELTQHAAAVAAVGGGTAGWEALQMGKPVMSFGLAWYRNMPGCFAFETVGSNLPQALQSFRFDRVALQREFHKRCRSFWPGILHVDYATTIPNYDPDASMVTAVKSILSYLEHAGFDPTGTPLAHRQPAGVTA